MFVVNGIILGHRGFHRARVSWHPPDERQQTSQASRGLDGEPELVRHLINMEFEGQEVLATPTGPVFTVDLDQPEPALLAIASLFVPGEYRVDGDAPEIDASYPPDAVP
jgi:hypothetical protein